MVRKTKNYIQVEIKRGKHSHPFAEGALDQFHELIKEAEIVVFKNKYPLLGKKYVFFMKEQIKGSRHKQGKISFDKMENGKLFLTSQPKGNDTARKYMLTIPADYPDDRLFVKILHQAYKRICEKPQVEKNLKRLTKLADNPQVNLKNLKNPPLEALNAVGWKSENDWEKSVELMTKHDFLVFNILTKNIHSRIYKEEQAKLSAQRKKRIQTAREKEQIMTRQMISEADFEKVMIRLCEILKGQTFRSLDITEQMATEVGFNKVSSLRARIGISLKNDRYVVNATPEKKKNIVYDWKQEIKDAARFGEKVDHSNPFERKAWLELELDRLENSVKKLQKTIREYEDELETLDEEALKQAAS